MWGQNEWAGVSMFSSMCSWEDLSPSKVKKLGSSSMRALKCTGRFHTLFSCFNVSTANLISMSAPLWRRVKITGLHKTHSYRATRRTATMKKLGEVQVVISRRRGRKASPRLSRPDCPCTMRPPKGRTLCVEFPGGWVNADRDGAPALGPSETKRHGAILRDEDAGVAQLVEHQPSKLVFILVTI